MESEQGAPVRRGVSFFDRAPDPAVTAATSGHAGAGVHDGFTGGVGDGAADMLVDALLVDFEAPVMLCDDALHVTRLSASARRYVESRGLDPANVRLNETMPEHVARERMPMIRHAMALFHPLHVLGMLNGVWTRSAYRPFVGESGRTYLLSAVVPVLESGLAESSGVRSMLHRARADDLGSLGVLTEREVEVLRLIGLGLSSEDIASVLHRSVKTVQGHRVALGTKLRITNRVELARIALMSGITKLDGEAIVQLWRQARMYHT